jgi:Lon-like ATP-dependent protease
MAMTTSLLSLAFNQPVSSNMAMTGEMTITGKVLKVDGLRDKIVAAKRSNIDTIFYPKDNQQDWVMLDADIKKGINGVPVSTYDDVFHVVFKNKNTK